MLFARSRARPKIMRKYYRAALMIVASISVVALLVYIHEYNKLRYVLTVFNYFGRLPNDNETNWNCNGVSSMASNKLYNNSAYYDNYERFDEPIPSWHRLTNEIYVYSAYRINEGEIRAVGLARPKRSNLIMSCGIFYENSVELIAGNFTYRTIESSSSEIDVGKRRAANYQGYHFICNYPIMENKKFIATVKFTTKPDTRANNEMGTVMLAVRETNDRSNDESKSEIFGVCVAPSINLLPIVDTDIINFLSFHGSLGIESFIIYNVGIASKFNDAMKRIMPIYASGLDTISREDNSSFVTYTTLPWNFPFTEISTDTINRIVQVDCLYRTYGKVRAVVTLTWNEYIVTKHHRTIAKLFSDIDKTGYSADRYKVSTLNLCVDRNESLTAPTVLVNRKISDNRSLYIYRRSTTSNEKLGSIDDSDVETRELSSEVIVANRYEENCDRSNSELEIVPLVDRYVGKFSKAIENSTISKLFRLHAR